MTNNRIRVNARRMLLDRGERLAIVAAGIAVLHAFATTDWTGYSVTPQEFTNRVADTRARMAVTHWPESEQQQFVFARGTAVADLVESRLRAPLDLMTFLPSQTPYHRLGAEKPPLVEPVLYPVQDLIAASERALLQQLPAHPPAEPENTASPDDVEVVVPDEFRTRLRQAPRPATQVDRGPTWSTSPADVDSPRPQGVPPAGHGYPFVSVRGLFDLPQQVQAYVDATHQAYPHAERTFEIIDFQLERQRQLGATAWSTWADVDRGVYFEIVRAAGGMEPDVVAADVTDSAISGPLPVRLTGRWDKLASHPGLDQFSLSGAELTRELEYLRALSRRAQQRQSSARGQITKRGFAALVQDVHGVRQSVLAAVEGATPGTGVRNVQPGFGTRLSNAEQQLQQLVQELVREISPGRTDPQLVNWIRARASAQRRQLLFRYLDFDVEPGETYRYRVRLEVRNPNFRKSLAAASTAGVVAGATRWTPYSEPTLPVAVEPLTTYFLTGLEPARLRPGVAARMHVYQYDQNAGSTVDHVLPVALGQVIGGTARTTRANPAKGVVEEGLYGFRSSDTLVDGIADLQFSAAEHPDLALPRDGRGRAFLAEMALVAHPQRGLTVIDTATQAADYARQQQMMRWQSEQFESLHPANYDESTSSDGDEMPKGQLPSSGPQRPAGTRPLNPLQRL